MFDQTMLNRLFRYCCSLCVQQSDAFDLLQSGVERCLRSPPKSSDASYAYAIRVIRNVFIDQFRRDGLIEQDSFEEDNHSIDYDISSLESLTIQQDELDRAWEKLSVVEREIMFLWAVEGYSTTEVARHLEKPRNTVLSLIHRMRQRLAAEGVTREGARGSL